MVCKVCLEDKSKEEFEKIMYLKSLAFRGSAVCLMCTEAYPTKQEKKNAFRAALKRNTKNLYAVIGDPKKRIKAKRSTENPDFREKLIANQTKAELRIRMLLDKSRIQYEFQKQIGPYFADFCFEERKLILEIDGGYHETKKQISKDKVRTKVLEGFGYRVMRFTNEQVFCEESRCRDLIFKAMNDAKSIGQRRYLSDSSEIVAVPRKPS